MTDQDPTTQMQTLAGVEYASQISFYEALSETLPAISSKPCVDNQDVLADEANNFETLESYTWDGEFCWGIAVYASLSRIWSDSNSVDKVDLKSSGPLSARGTQKVKDVYRELKSLKSALVVNEGLDDDFWHYRTYGERVYVEKLCVIPAEQLWMWENRHIVHVKTIIWDKASLALILVMKNDLH